MSKPLHSHKSDADFLLHVAKRLRNVPASYGLDQFDVDCLADMSSRLRKAKKPTIAIGTYTITELCVGRSCETDIAILIPADDLELWDSEERTERKLATVAAPDNGSPAEVLAAVLECARAWVPEARIMGNVRAGDIARVVADVLAERMPQADLIVPEGWKVVPVELTEEMIGGHLPRGSSEGTKSYIREIWNNLLSSSPAPALRTE